MVGIDSSCNPEKLRQVIRACKVTMKSFYGLTPDDKEDVLLEVMWQFEKDGGRYPATVYARYCVNKVLQFIEFKTAKKRMASMDINGVQVYLENVSLNDTIGISDEDEAEVGDTVSKETDADKFLEIELLADIERSAPDLVPTVYGALHGTKITKRNRSKLQTKILNTVPIF